MKQRFIYPDEALHTFNLAVIRSHDRRKIILDFIHLRRGLTCRIRGDLFTCEYSLIA
ncbi:hypothetical protein D3C85_1082920 [compost metagenome]